METAELMDCPQIALNDLRESIDPIRNAVKTHTAFYLGNPDGELFQGNGGLGVLVDPQSAKVICLIYDSINETNRAKFHSELVQDEYKFANFLDGLWDMVKAKKGPNS